MGENISIRFAGMGGQGIIFSGIVLARAFALYERRDGREMNATQTQSYGPEARGGASKCDVKVSEDEGFYPLIEVPDYLVLMSKPAYDKYLENTNPETVVVLDKGSIEDRPDLEHYVVPATEKAEEMEARIVANVIMLGAFVSISGIVSHESVMRALGDVAPRGTEDLNKKAYRLGMEVGNGVKEGKLSDSTESGSEPERAG
ncbi:MAG: 2-oxoacid:acceptor oxidoreductase family protein [Methanomassiliicoccales archaeon]